MQVRYLTFMLLSFLNHAVNLLLGETTFVVSDGDAVGISGGLVQSKDAQDTVGINIKGNFNLRNTTRSRWNARQHKLAQQVVVLGVSTISFVHFNKQTSFVVRGSGEDLRLLGRNGGVTLDKSRHDTTSRLDTKRMRSNIKEKKVLSLLRSVTRKNGSLDGSTMSNGFVGVDPPVRFFAVKEVGNEFDDMGDAGGTTD